MIKRVWVIGILILSFNITTMSFLVSGLSSPGESWMYSQCPPKANYLLDFSENNITGPEWEISFYAPWGQYVRGYKYNMTRIEIFEKIKNSFLNETNNQKSFREYFNKTGYDNHFDELYFTFRDGQFWITEDQFFGAIFVVIENTKTKQIFFSDLEEIPYDPYSIFKNFDNYYSYDIHYQNFNLSQNKLEINFTSISPIDYECSKSLFEIKPKNFNLTEDWKFYLLPAINDSNLNYGEYSQIKEDYLKIKNACGVEEIKKVVFTKSISCINPQVREECKPYSEFLNSDSSEVFCDSPVNNTENCSRVYNCTYYADFRIFLARSQYRKFKAYLMEQYIYTPFKQHLTWSNIEINQLMTKAPYLMVLEKMNSNEIYFSDFVQIEWERDSNVDWSKKYLVSKPINYYELYPLRMSIELDKKSNKLITDYVLSKEFTYKPENCQLDEGDGSVCNPGSVPEGYLGLPRYNVDTLINQTKYNKASNSSFLLISILVFFLVILVILAVVYWILKRKKVLCK